MCKDLMSVKYTMKRHSIRAARSRSKQTSINKHIQGGTRIDRLYYGKYLPLRETKLLEQITKTRTAYDDVRNELMSASGSSEHTQTGNELRLRDKPDNKKNSVVMKTVGVADRGRFDSSNACKLKSCCSSCSCSSLKIVEKHMERHRPPYGHHTPSENITKHTVEAERTDRRRKRRLSTKISSKFRNVNYKVKRIQSEPLSSIVTRPSKVCVNRSRSKATAIENGKFEKDNNKTNPLRKRSYAFKIAILPMNTSKKIKNTRHSAIKDGCIDIEKQKPFEIQKDSLSLFRQKIKNEHPSYECEPGSCFVDNCIPEKCLQKMIARNLMYAKRNKYCSRHSGSGRSYVSVTRRLRNPNTRKSHNQVTTTRTPRLKSFSSMTTISLRNSLTDTDYVRTETKKVGSKCPKQKPFTQIKTEKEHMPRKRTASVIFCNRGQECKATRKCSCSLTTILDSRTLQSVPKTELTKVMRPVTPRPRQQLATRKSEEKACAAHCNKKRIQIRSENKALPAQGSVIREMGKEKRIYTISQQKPMINFKSRMVEPFQGLNRSSSSMTKVDLVKPLKQEQRYKILNHTIIKELEENKVKNNQPIRTQVMSKSSQVPILPTTNQSRHRKNKCDSTNCAQILSKSKGRLNTISVQSTKNTESFLNKPRANKFQGLPIKNKGNYINVENSSYNFGFYKNKSGMEGGDQAHSKYGMKQKCVQLERKTHCHKMQNTNRPCHNIASQSRSSQFKNKQVGNRLKQCLCSLKLFQKKRQRKSHVASKKTIASIYTEELKNGGHKKQTQTKQLGISLVSPPLTSIRAPPAPCEPCFCTPGERKPYNCAERKKMRNHTARRSKLTNTIPISKRSSGMTTRPLSKSISRKIQCNENRHRKEKGNNANTLKIKSRVTSKSARQDVRMHSSFKMFNVQLSKRNRNYAPQNKEKQYKLKSDNNTKKENQRYQQRGIRVYKPHDHQKTLETKADGHTYTDPVLKKWLFTLGLWKNNNECVDASPPLRSKNTHHVMQLQNKLITANRADIIYNYARPKLSLEYKSETRASNVNENLKKNCQWTQENSNTVDRKTISDNPNTSSKQYNQNKDSRHSDCKTNFLNQCYLPVQNQSSASKAKNCIDQKAIDVTQIQQNKGTHSYFGSVFKRFFSFNPSRKHQQLENQNIIFQKNTQVMYLSSHENVNQNATKKLNKPNVYSKYHDGDSKHFIPLAETYNPYGYYDRTRLQQMTRPFDSCIRTDELTKKSVTNNLKSKSTQSKIFKKYAKSIPHRNGRTPHRRSSLRLPNPMRSNFNVNISRNRTACVIQNQKDICYKDILYEKTLKHQLSQNMKREHDVSNGDSLLKRYFCRPILEQKNTDSKPKNSNRQTNANQPMTTKLNSDNLQSSRKNSQSISKSDFIFGQNSVKKPNYDTKRIQNNYTLAKSRQFRSRTDLNVREYQIGYCLSTRENNPFNPSLYAPNVRAFSLKNVPLKVPTNYLLEVNKCDPSVCSQYESDINNRFQRSKLYHADTLDSNLVGCYKHKSDEKADVMYSKTQNFHVDKGKHRQISVRSRVNTTMGGNNDVDRYRRHELHNQTFLSKCFRSLFKKERYNKVNQSVLTNKKHSDPSRKTTHFGSDFLIDAKFLKQAKPDLYFASNDKTQTQIHNHHIRNRSSQVHYKTPSRATGITKLLSRCICTANMQYEVQKQVESQKVINNLNYNGLRIKNSKITRKLKHIEEPNKLDRATRTKIYNNVMNDEYRKENFNERKTQSTRTYKRIHQNSQTIGMNYPKYHTSNLSERNRTFQPKIQYQKYNTRDWLPYPNYCVLRCENSQNSKFFKFSSNFGMCIDYPRNKNINTCPGMTMDKCNQLQGTGDGYGPAARAGKTSKKSQIEVDYTDKSIGERQLNSKNTQFKKKKSTRSKSVATSHDTRTQQENINGINPARPILLEEKEGGIIQLTQTDRELKTIMPYSKKKFHKLDSSTKLSHHSTNTPGLNNTLRSKGQTRNEQHVINKHGDYLVYHEQNLQCTQICRGPKLKGYDNKSPADNIVADRNANQDNIYGNRTADQDNIHGNRTAHQDNIYGNRTANQDNIQRNRSAHQDNIYGNRTAKQDANREATQDSSYEARLDRIMKNFRRGQRQQNETNKPLSDSYPKGNNVMDKDKEVSRSDRYSPLGRWRGNKDRNANQDDIYGNRNANQDNIHGNRTAHQDNINRNRTAKQDNISAHHEAALDAAYKGRIDRFMKNFRRGPRQQNETNKPLSDSYPKGNVVVDKDEDVSRSGRYSPLGRWRQKKDRNAKKDNMIASRTATKDATQDSSDESRFERVRKAFRRRPRGEMNIPQDPEGKRDVIVVRPNAAQVGVDGVHETRLEMIKRAFRRRPHMMGSHPPPSQCPVPEPLFEIRVHKNDMTIANPQDVLPMLKTARYRGTAPGGAGSWYRGVVEPQSQPEESVPHNSFEDRIEMLKRVFRLRQKNTENPLFEMVVHKNKMLVMNKDEVFPILDAPEKRYRRRKDDPCKPPLMELQVDRTTAGIINADEIVRKLKAERERHIVRKHRGGCVSQSEGEALVKLHGKTCNCCFCRKYRVQRQTQRYRKRYRRKFTVKPRLLKTCTCGSDVCIKDWTKLKEEQSDMEKVKDIPPCVCGSDVCNDEFEKIPEKRLKAFRRQRQKEIAEKNDDEYQRARRRRLKKHRLQETKRMRVRQTSDKRQMNQIKKIKLASPAVMAAESLRDFGALSCRCLGGSIRSFAWVVRRPKDAVYNLRDFVRTIKRRPDKVIGRIKQSYDNSALKSTLARVKERAVRTNLGKKVKNKMESNAITSYLLHITEPDAQARIQMLRKKKGRRRRRRREEPVDYEGSLYMNTLRKKPFLRVYSMCPWFYPHCVNLFGIWKQLANVLMFLLAICIWSPCILCFEVCRALVCCCMCSGYDM